MATAITPPETESLNRYMSKTVKACLPHLKTAERLAERRIDGKEAGVKVTVVATVAKKCDFCTGLIRK